MNVHCNALNFVMKQQRFIFLTQKCKKVLSSDFRMILDYFKWSLFFIYKNTDDECGKK